MKYVLLALVMMSSVAAIVADHTEGQRIAEYIAENKCDDDNGSEAA